MSEPGMNFQRDDGEKVVVLKDRISVYMRVDFADGTGEDDTGIQHNNFAVDTKAVIIGWWNDRYDEDLCGPVIKVGGPWEVVIPVREQWIKEV